MIYSIDEKTPLSTKKGDLTFYFPYYYPNQHDGLNPDQLIFNKVSHVLVYRRSTYPGIIDKGNYRLINTLFNNFRPAHIVKIKKVEISWIFDVKSIIQSSQDFHQ